MKTSIFGLFLIVCVFVVSIQDDPFIYEPLDQSLISLWVAADDKNAIRCSENAGYVALHLGYLHSILQENKTPHFDKKQFIKYTSTVNKVMSKYVQKKDFKKMKFFAIDLLYENYSLRECLSISDYPIDNLLRLSQSFSAVHKTVDDPMMELLEWNEFVKQVDEMIENWEAYDCLTMEFIHSYFPSIPIEDHQQLKDKANDCLTEFIDSLQTGYRNDFQLPCDDLGYAFSNLLKIYSYDE